MSVSTELPFLLLPVRLETRFSEEELWIRVFPDKIFQSSFQPSITVAEKEDRAGFLAITTEAERKVAWGELVEKHGAYRAAWLVNGKNQEVVEEDRRSSIDFKCLPDFFQFYLYKGGWVKEVTGKPIPSDGLSLFAETGAAHWMQDFEAAIEVGMAVKIDIGNRTHFDRIIAVGMRNTDDQEELSALIRDHQFSSGFSFLKYGTPTNNTEVEKSGYSIREKYDATDSYEYVFSNGATLLEEVPSYSRTLAKGLGMPAEQLAGIRDADYIPAQIIEDIRKVSGFSLGHRMIELIGGQQYDPATKVALWEHVAKYVKARGHFPAVKVANQPYGVVPVSKIPGRHSALPAGENFQQNLEHVLAVLFTQWGYYTSQVPTIHQEEATTDANQQLLTALNMHHGSISHQFSGIFQRTSKSENLSDDLPTYDLTIPKFDINQGWKWETHSYDYDIPYSRKDLPWVVALFMERGGVVNSRGMVRELKETIFQKMRDMIPEQVLSDEQIEYAQNIPLAKVLESEQPNESLNFPLLSQELEQSLLGHLLQFPDNFDQSYRISFQPPAEKLLKKCKPYVVEDIKVNINTRVEKGDLLATAFSTQERHLYKHHGAADFTEVKENNKTIIEIRSPSRGMVKRRFIEEGQQLFPDNDLFLIQSDATVSKVNSEWQEARARIKAYVEEGNEEDLELAERALTDALDINTYRLDAWITSLAARKLAEIRATPATEQGIFLGAYSWLEDVKKEEVAENPHQAAVKGGIIHAPSPEQAVAAAVAKNAFLTHLNDKGNPYTLNLTSERVQQAELLLEGLRQDQQLGALLGYRFERSLHEAQLDRLIYKIKTNSNGIFLLDKENTKMTMNSLDGLAILKHRSTLLALCKATEKEGVKKAIQHIETLQDASLDALFFEAGFQAVQGNYSQSSAAMQAIKGDLAPPKLEAFKTRLPSASIQHKLAMVFSAKGTYGITTNPKGFTEPVLERWLEQHIGPVEDLACVIELYQPGESESYRDLEVKLNNRPGNAFPAEINLHHLDLLYLSTDEFESGSSELEMRIWDFAKRSSQQAIPEGSIFKMSERIPVEGRPLHLALELYRYAFHLLTESRYLRSEDLSSDPTAVHYDWPALEQIRQRLIYRSRDEQLPYAQDRKILYKLRQWAGAPIAERTLELLAKCNLPEAKQLFYKGAEAVQREALQAQVAKIVKEAEKHLDLYEQAFALKADYYQAFEHLRAAARAVFGPSFVLLAPCMASNEFITSIDQDNQRKLVGPPGEAKEGSWGQECLREWLDGVAAVHAGAERFEDWEILNQVWRESAELERGRWRLRIAQTPTVDQYPWVGLEEEKIRQLLVDYDPSSVYPLEPEQYFPDHSESTLLFMSPNWYFGDPSDRETRYGLVFEEFVEAIPDKKVDSGVSFQYDAPNQEAPQALLLAVPTDEMQQRQDAHWTHQDLREIVQDTLALAKVRMVDLHAMNPAGAEAYPKLGFSFPMTLLPITQLSSSLRPRSFAHSSRELNRMKSLDVDELGIRPTSLSSRDLKITGRELRLSGNALSREINFGGAPIIVSFRKAIRQLAFIFQSDNAMLQFQQLDRKGVPVAPPFEHSLVSTQRLPTQQDKQISLQADLLQQVRISARNLEGPRDEPITITLKALYYGT